MNALVVPLRCHKCGSADLVLYETRHEHAQYDGGLVLTEDGRIEALDEGISTPGDVQVQMTRIECESCGHNWHPRRSFSGRRTAPRD